MQFKIEIIEALEFLQSTFGVKMSDSQALVYSQALATVNPVKLCAAAEKISRESKFFPRLAELLDTIRMIPDPFSLGVDLSARRKRLHDRFYRTREIDRDGFDLLYRECREAGFWAKAEFVRELEKRFEEILRVEDTVYMVEQMQEIAKEALKEVKE